MGWFNHQLDNDPDKKIETNFPTRMSQEVSKRLGSVGYNPMEYPIYK